MGIIKRTRYFTVFIVISMLFGSALYAQNQSNPNRLISKLRTNPVWEHREIYGTYDTQLIQTKALRKTMVDIGLKGWYQKVIRPYELDIVERPWDVEMGKLSRTLAYYRGLLSDMKDFDNPRYVELWIKLLSGGPVSGKEERKILAHEFKTHGRTYITTILKLIEHRSKKDHKRADPNQELRELTNTWYIPRITYEVVRSNSGKLNKRSMRKIEEFARDTLKANSIVGNWKKFSVNFFRDRGWSEQKITNLLFMPDYKREDGRILKGKLLEKGIIRESKEWRSEYPKWPVEGESGFDLPEKVTICHKPTFGVVHKPTTITIAREALDTHLKHGDSRGACEGGQ